MAIGQTMYYEMYGNGVPLVLLHGWGWHSNVWRPIVPELAKYFQVILLDLPGFGKSLPLPGEYTLENIARQILTILPITAHWLGWSMGGLITSWIASHYPQYVNKHVLVASSPCFIQAQNWPGMDSLVFDDFGQNLLANCKQTLNNFLLLQVKGASNQRELIRQLRIIMFQYEPIGTVLQAGLSLLGKTDLRGFLPTKAPSLYIFGEYDAIVPVAVLNSIQLLSSLSYSYVIKKACHLPFLSHPQEFLTVVIDFLKKD